MPRVARLVLPGIPHHVTQRGNRSQRTFFGPDDYRLYQQSLRRWAGEARTAVWAWCLMPNHVHIIVVPEDETGLRRLFGPLHRQYTWQVNQREDWRGCLWQGRYGSVAMDEAHLHVCLRYVELNPVRAGLVERPEAWPWSSARAHLGLAGEGITTSRRCGGGSTIGGLFWTWASPTRIATPFAPPSVRADRSAGPSGEPTAPRTEGRGRGDRYRYVSPKSTGGQVPVRVPKIDGGDRYRYVSPKYARRVSRRSRLSPG